MDLWPIAMSALHDIDAIKGYRVKGGAVIRVFRGDRVRRYRISGRRFCALRLRFAGAAGWHGYFGNSTIDIYTRHPTRECVPNNNNKKRGAECYSQ